MKIEKIKSTKKDVIKSGGKSQNASSKNRNETVLFYRWLILFFSAVLCITGARFDVQGYAILESLAVAAIYNGVVSAYLTNKKKKSILPVQYIDIMILAVLIYFSGGIQSDLYVFIFFLIGFCGINNEITDTIKIAVASTIFYTAICILSGRFNAGDIDFVTLAIRNILFIMAAFATSKINREVRKFDEMRKNEFRIARTDKLTGLANRHYFDQKLKDEVDYVLSKGTVLNILMFDLDNFKGFNDTYGHVSGDKLLTLFSDIIRQCVRKSDTPVRYGGEEFVILIRDLDIIIAKSVADRIRKQLENQRIYLGHQGERQRVTVSCGVAQFPTHSSDIKEVLENSDQALYHAKKTGKNKVVCYDDIPHRIQGNLYVSGK